MYVWWSVLQQFNISAQQQQLGLQQQQHRLMRLLVKIIKANGLADGDFGICINVLRECVQYCVLLQNHLGCCRGAGIQS